MRSIIVRTALVLVLLNALAPLFFPATITLDGPMHVLHASAWLDARDHDQGIRYHQPFSHLSADELLLAPLVRTLGPFHAHTVMVALVLLVLGLASWRVAQKLELMQNAGPLLVLPVLWGWPLLLGFFSFLLGIALALLAWGWWAGLDRPSLRNAGLLFVWGLGAMYVHRAAPLFLILLVVCHELTMLIGGRMGWSARWPRVPPWLLWAVVIGLSALGGLRIMSLLYENAAFEPSAVRDPSTDLLQLRPLLLFAKDQEQPYLIVLGALLLIALVLTTSARGFRDRRIQRADAALLAALVLITASLVLRNPNADLHYVEERTQWTALLLLVLWTGSAAWSRMTLVVAPVAIGLHVIRTVHIAKQMAGFHTRQQALETQAQELHPGSTVVPVLCDGNWLYLHQTAFLATLHDGVVWTPIDHMRFRFAAPATSAMIAYDFKKAKDWSWLEDHLNAGRSPLVDRIVPVGPDGTCQASDTIGMGPACRLLWSLDK